MFRAIGLDVATRRDVVLQTWLSEEADVGHEVILQAKACTYRPLQWSVERRFLFQFFHTIHEIACSDWRIDGYLQLCTKTSVETPSPYVMYFICTLQRYAKVVDGL